MMRNLTRLIQNAFTPTESPRTTGDHDSLVRKATAGLLVEIALADESISEVEERTMLSHLRTEFGISESEARELIEVTREMRRQSIDHWALTRELRTLLPLPKKIEVVKAMWRIVFSDGVLHAYETHLVRKLADLLGLEHHTMIEAKLEVRAELDRN